MPDATPPDRCTVSMDNIKLCGLPSLDDAPIPVCFKHASALFAFMKERLDAASAAGTDFRAMRVIAAMSNSMSRIDEAHKAQRPDPVVYYIRVGDLIKIGTTGNLANRRSAYPPYSTLLATEPGSYELERERHQQFASCLMSGKEWFRPTPRLMAHIESLRANAA